MFPKGWNTSIGGKCLKPGVIARNGLREVLIVETNKESEDTGLEGLVHKLEEENMERKEVTFVSPLITDKPNVIHEWQRCSNLHKSAPTWLPPLLDIEKRDAAHQLCCNYNLQAITWQLHILSMFFATILTSTLRARRILNAGELIGTRTRVHPTMLTLSARRQQSRAAQPSKDATILDSHPAESERYHKISLI